MGYMAHHAIVVTSWSLPDIARARDEAKRVGLAVSDVVVSPVNSQRSFMVAPDGSKEGWRESDDGDAQRDVFVAWLNLQRHDDGSSNLRWTEIVLPEDGPAKVCRCDYRDTDRPSAPDGYCLDHGGPHPCGSCGQE